ncbi:MAG: hypothetical protein M3415_06325 [Actinomycetota bacterium]|nr:hypothetical protein [Actinomycetota bacterium]
MGYVAGSSLLVLFAAVAVAPTIWVAAAAWTLISLSTGAFNVIGRSLRQIIVPDRMIGRAGGLPGARVRRGPRGAIGGGVIATAFGIRGAFAAGLVVKLAAALLFARVVTEPAVADAVVRAGRTVGDDTAKRPGA